MNDKLRKAVELMKKGNEKGFNEVYAYTCNRVYFRARQIMKNEEDAQDLVQIVFIEAYKTIHTLQSAEALNSWLDRITYRQGMKIFRKKKDVLLCEEGKSLLDRLESSDISSMPEPAADHKASGEIIRSIIGELSEQQRNAIVMYYFDGLKVEQIAELTECSVNTVKSRLRYARNFIRERVEEKEEKEGYRLHAVGFWILWFVFKTMVGGTMLMEHAARVLCNGICAGMGQQTLPMRRAQRKTWEWQMRVQERQKQEQAQKSLPSER